MFRPKNLIPLRFVALFVAVFVANDVALSEPMLAKVQTAVGNTTYVGNVSQAQPNIAEYLGIPYAKPPIGERRWREPDTAVRLPEIYPSQSFKPACYQDAYNIKWYQQVASHFDQTLDMKMPTVSEDCLYLNIWSHGDGKSNTPLKPVVVWIHGGSNKAGWAYEPNYLGHNLANDADVVVVSVAYRLGVFGFLAHPQLQQQAYPTNFALLDQIAALKWIQKNIQAFGGDKNNITLMGESAGAANIGYLMSLPAARGLFHRAVSQSGAFQMMAESDLASGMAFGSAISDAFDGADIAILRNVDTATLWQAAKQIDPDYDYRALVDNKLFAISPPTAFQKYAAVDLLIGSNEHEFYMYQDAVVSEPSLAMPITNKKAEQELIDKFLQFKDARSGQDWLDTFLYMACPSTLMAKLVTDKGQRAWLYQFSRIRESGDTIKAYHGAEIPYVFDTHDSWLPTNDIDQKVTQAMVFAWSNFAHYGDPNHLAPKTKTPWPPFSSDSPQLQVFDNDLNVAPVEAYLLCQTLWPDYLK